MHRHRVDCEDEHGDVAEDDHDRGDDEAQHEVVVHVQPAVAARAVAAELQGVEAHVLDVVVAVDLDEVHGDGGDDDQ